jgi:hypothetical protein
MKKELVVAEEYDEYVDDERQSRRERVKNGGLRNLTPPRLIDKRWNKVEYEMGQSLLRSLNHFRAVKSNNATQQIKDGLAAAMAPELFGRLQLNFFPSPQHRRNNSILAFEIEKTKVKAHEPKKSTQLQHDYTLRVEMYNVIEVKSVPTQLNKLLLLAKGGSWRYFDNASSCLGENEQLRALPQDVLFEELQKNFDGNPDAEYWGIVSVCCLY